MDDDGYRNADAAERKPLCCCDSAHVDVGETTAMILFVVQFLGIPSCWIGSCIDRKGCNWSMFFLQFVPFAGICIWY